MTTTTWPAPCGRPDITPVFALCLDVKHGRLLGTDICTLRPSTTSPTPLPRPHITSQRRACRNWINERGGAVYCTSWGKFWMSILGCYEWRGQNPLPPEMWLLPYRCRSVSCGVAVALATPLALACA